VIQKNLTQLLDRGIRASDEQTLASTIAEAEQVDEISRQRGQAIREELEAIRVKKQKLIEQQALLEDMLEDSQKWLGLDARHFRAALSASLEILGAQPLAPTDPTKAVDDLDHARWELPALDQRAGADPNWATTLDTLRPSRKRGQKLWDWRRETSIRPVVFRDPGSIDGEVVHLHLEHRLVQRLLGRFLAQGFLYDELTRACICLTNEPVPKVVVLGRLSLYGERAARLHDEVVAVAAQWIDPAGRGRGQLRPLSEGEKETVLTVLENSLAIPDFQKVPPALIQRLKGFAAQDVEELLPHLERRAALLTERAKRKLLERGKKEAAEMQTLLIEQRDRIRKQVQQSKTQQLSLFNRDELRQLEADRHHWQTRVAELETEIYQEPERIQQAYQVKAERVEPVGLVYLWPVSS